MIQTATRPFTDAEREAVERQLLNYITEPRRSEIPNALWGAFTGFVCGAILAMIAMLLFEVSETWGANIIAVSVVSGFVLGWRSQQRDAIAHQNNRRQHAAKLAKRLQRGEMEEVIVTASGVVRVEDREVGINGCFFDIGDREVLYLSEDTLWNAAENAGPDGRDAETFLPSAFRLTRYPDARDEVVHLKPVGPLLTPLRTIVSSWLENEYYDLADGEVIEGVSLATLEKDLPYLSGSEIVE
ncbi:MAG: hypothetical protein H8F28_01005 [Fibrella sp.]|nr:hypothetical protein [Armatimonadota bacterium]